MFLMKFSWNKNDLLKLVSPQTTSALTSVWSRRNYLKHDLVFSIFQAGMDKWESFEVVNILQEMSILTASSPFRPSIMISIADLLHLIIRKRRESGNVCSFFLKRSVSSHFSIQSQTWLKSSNSRSIRMASLRKTMRLLIS